MTCFFPSSPSIICIKSIYDIFFSKILFKININYIIFHISHTQAHRIYTYIPSGAIIVKIPHNLCVGKYTYQVSIHITYTTYNMCVSKLKIYIYLLQNQFKCFLFSVTVAIEEIMKIVYAPCWFAAHLHLIYSICLHAYALKQTHRSCFTYTYVFFFMYVVHVFAYAWSHPFRQQIINMSFYIAHACAFANIMRRRDNVSSSV